MSDSLSIKIDNEKVTKALRRLSEKTSNLRPVMRAIAENIMDSTKENFFREGARLGEKWQDLSPLTKKWRSEHGYDGKMLQVKRKLYNSISAYSDNDSAIVGTNLVYAKVHQLGIDKSVSIKAHTRKILKAGKKRKSKIEVKAHSKELKIPARPFLGLTDGDIKGIEGLILDAIYGKL